jgi:hypothetical protein
MERFEKKAANFERYYMAQRNSCRRFHQVLLFAVFLLCTKPVFASSLKKIKGKLEVLVSDKVDGTGSAMSYQVRNKRGVRHQTSAKKGARGAYYWAGS